MEQVKAQRPVMLPSPPQPPRLSRMGTQQMPKHPHFQDLLEYFWSVRARKHAQFLAEGADGLFDIAARRALDKHGDVGTLEGSTKVIRPVQGQPSACHFRVASAYISNPRNLLSNPIMGRAADRFGRRPMIILAAPCFKAGLGAPATFFFRCSKT